MSTQTPSNSVYVPDTYPHFQPIQLPIGSLIDLHRQTAATLKEFVTDHREKFPRGPVGAPRLRR